MKAELQRELETPCLVIDMEKAGKNIGEMQRQIQACGCRLRPHIKTHKMPLFARMQIAAGAQGITCAKVSEAEVMAEGGCEDIFIAYPMVGDFRIRRALRLMRRVKRLILAVDSLEGAKQLDLAAQEAGVMAEVRLEVDTGAKRTGVLEAEAVGLAKAVNAMGHLRLTGIYTFKGMVYQGQGTCDRKKAGEEEGLLMGRLAQNMRSAGILIEDVSAGSSPTGIEAAATGLVNEVRPGTYIFKDRMMCEEGVASREEIAARYFATVVSTPCEEYAVIDGGTKTFPTDILLGQPPYYYDSYAEVENRPDLKLCRMNEEHGILTGSTGKTGLKVGDVLALFPVHVCTAVNLQNVVYLDYGNFLQKERVAARGMLV